MGTFEGNTFDSCFQTTDEWYAKNFSKKQKKIICVLFIPQQDSYTDKKVGKFSLFLERVRSKVMCKEMFHLIWENAQMFSNENMSMSILIYDMNRYFPLVFKQVSSSILFNFFQPYYLLLFLEIKYCHQKKTSKTWKVPFARKCKFLMVVSQRFLHYFSSCYKHLTLILQNLFF